jgi:hypothetical protein
VKTSSPTVTHLPFDGMQFVRKRVAITADEVVAWGIVLRVVSSRRTREFLETV